MGGFLEGQAAKILGAKYKLEELSNNFDVRKMAARVENEEQEDYYILCGWMSEKDVAAFIEETKDDDRITIVEEEGRRNFGDPPTKLKNPRFFSHLRCLSGCTGCRPMTKWIRPFLWR